MKNFSCILAAMGLTGGQSLLTAADLHAGQPAPAGETNRATFDLKQYFAMNYIGAFAELERKSVRDY